jgi:hypothetical protein
MGGANTGRSNKGEEANPLEERRHKTPTTNIETTSSPTRHKVTMHTTPKAPPSGTAVPTYHRSSSSRNAAQPSHPQPKLHRANCS